MSGYSHTTIYQDEMTRKRVLDEKLKLIQQQQGRVMIALGVWLRAKHSMPKEAERAMQQLIEARSEENRLFRSLFGIKDDCLAIGYGDRR
jgi:hypothetical protein